MNTDAALVQKVRKSIREIPDFPKAGINFYDITTVLKDGPLFREIIDTFTIRYQPGSVDMVIGIESRGFIFGAPLAANLKAGFVPVRKPGKLPAAVEKAEYTLEYGSNSLELHRDGVVSGAKILVVDDLLATGGTAQATVELVTRLGGTVVECLFLIELAGLGGREKLQPTPVVSMLSINET